MDLASAFQTVIDLARQNIVSQRDDTEGHQQQREAVNQVEDFAVNHLADE